jgi:hypothetical protein
LGENGWPVEKVELALLGDLARRTDRVEMIAEERQKLAPGPQESPSVSCAVAANLAYRAVCPDGREDLVQLEVTRLGEKDVARSDQADPEAFCGFEHAKFMSPATVGTHQLQPKAAVIY